MWCALTVICDNIECVHIYRYMQNMINLKEMVTGSLPKHLSVKCWPAVHEPYCMHLSIGGKCNPRGLFSPLMTRSGQPKGSLGRRTAWSRNKTRQRPGQYHWACYRCAIVWDSGDVLPTDDASQPVIGF